jgi:uncharacterized protein YegL
VVGFSVQENQLPMKNKYLILILGVLLTSFPVFSQKKAKVEHYLQANIIFVVDYSGSIAGAEKFYKKMFVAFGDELPLSPDGIKFSIVSFSDVVKVEQPLTGSLIDFYTTIDLLDRKKPVATDAFLANAIDTAVFVAVTYWADHNESEDNQTPVFIVIVTDGMCSDLEQALVLSQAERGNNKIMLYTILVPTKGESNPGVLRDIATNPMTFLESDYNELIHQLQRMNKEY